jgi:hypothetical protein
MRIAAEVLCWEKLSAENGGTLTVHIPAIPRMQIKR